MFPELTIKQVAVDEAQKAVVSEPFFVQPTHIVSPGPFGTVKITAIDIPENR